MSTSKPRLPGSYWKLWSGTAISALGDGFLLACIPLLASNVTRNPLVISLLVFAEFAPWLLFSLFAGAAVDRYERLRLITVVEFARALLLGVFTGMVILASPPIVALMVLSFLIGVGQTITQPASQALVPGFVAGDRLERANAFMAQAETVGSDFLGPPLGALLFGIAVSVPFLLDGVSFLASGLLVAAAGRAAGAMPERPARSGRSLPAEVLAGFRWLRGQPLLVGTTLLAAVLGFADSMWFSILVLFSRERLHSSSFVYGLMLVGGALGAIGAGIVAATFLQKLRPQFVLLTAVVGIGCIQLLLAVQHHWQTTLWLLVASGFLFELWNIQVLTIQQRRVPNEMLGRVISTYKFVGRSALAVGAVTGGAIALQFGLSAPFFVGGVLVLLGALVGAIVPGFGLSETKGAEA